MANMTNAYGAVTWGQFFVYQGFNDRAGWMHTSSGVDAIDEYLETVTQKGNAFFYKYGNEEKPFVADQITVKYKTDRGMEEKLFTVFRTHPLIHVSYLIALIPGIVLLANGALPTL